MNPADSMRWRQTDGQLQLGDGASPVAVIALDGATIARRCFHHDPPRPADLEHAIDLVEDALMGVAAAVGRPSEFVTSDPVLLRLPGAQPGSHLDAEAVEVLFQRLASASLGDPSAGRGLPAGGEAAATLLLLRETLHHFGVGAVVFRAD